MIEYIHKFFQSDPWVKAIFSAALNQVALINNTASQIDLSQIFSKCSEEILGEYEKDMGLSPKNQTLEDRRSTVEGRWKAAGKCDIPALQSIADSWRNGACDIEFTDNVILIKFISEYGHPTDIETLLSAIEEMKPAHIPLEYDFKYHTWAEYETQKWEAMTDKTWNDVLEGNYEVHRTF